MALVLEKFRSTMFPAMIRVRLDFLARRIFDPFSLISLNRGSPEEDYLIYLILDLIARLLMPVEFKPVTLFADTKRFDNRYRNQICY